MTLSWTGTITRMNWGSLGATQQHPPYHDVYNEDRRGRNDMKLEKEDQ
jgi:hypothetical protein